MKIQKNQCLIAKNQRSSYYKAFSSINIFHFFSFIKITDFIDFSILIIFDPDDINQMQNLTE